MTGIFWKSMLPAGWGLRGMDFRVVWNQAEYHEVDISIVGSSKLHSYVKFFYLPIATWSSVFKWVYAYPH